MYLSAKVLYVDVDENIKVSINIDIRSTSMYISEEKELKKY